MNKRKEKILRTIIKEYIKTGAPVGSLVLVEKYKMNISSATARNEMSELEQAGYIMQPHTSAGRVPTEKAYRFYLNKVKDGELNFWREKIKLSPLNKVLLERNEQAFKNAAKTMALLSDNAVFWAINNYNFYYTGLTNLFNQPEFFKIEAIQDISEIIDNIDEVINKIFSKIPTGTTVFLGSENPFGSLCSSIVAKYNLDNSAGLFGIIGPMRMNYVRNLAIVEFVYNKLKN